MTNRNYKYKIKMIIYPQILRKEVAALDNGKLPETQNNNNGNDGGEKKRGLEWSKKYTTIAIYTLLVILFAVVCVFFFLNYNDFGKYLSKIFTVFNPILYGILFAYLLNYAVKFFEHSVFGFLEKKEGKRRLQRLLSVFLTILLVLLAFSLVLWILVPQVIAGYKDLESKMSFYIESVQKWLAGLSEGDGFLAPYFASAVEYINNFIDKAYELIQNIAPSIASIAKNVVITVKDVLLGLVFAIYFLIAKERLCAQLKKLIRAVLGEKLYAGSLRVGKLIDEKFGSFLTRKIIDSIIVGLLCFFGGWAIGISYYPLVSIIIGVTNVVPLFGPIVGILVTGFIVFISSMDPWLMTWYLVFIILLHAVNSNLISRKLLGDTSGLSATWIFIAIVAMAGFFGVAGMVIGVPTFAVLYDLLKVQVEKKLSKKQAPVSTRDYYEGEDGVLLAEEAEKSKKKHREKSERRYAKFLVLLHGKKASPALNPGENNSDGGEENQNPESPAENKDNSPDAPAKQGDAGKTADGTVQPDKK